MNRVAIMSIWNNALWVEAALRWGYGFFDRILVQEANWTEDDPAWAGETSPDGTAALIRAFPDPEQKIEFYQLGRWSHGCLAARAELCSRIPGCNWVYVMDADEFQSEAFLEWLAEELPRLQRKGYTTISQAVRAFYWDFTRHTTERFTRWMRYYPGINCWSAQYHRPGDFDVALELGTDPLAADTMGPEIFHYSYVPTQGVRIKGAKSFDVTPERYESWYELFRSFDGSEADLQRIYAANQGGVHVFGGMPVSDYRGAHPAILAEHPLRHARWKGQSYLDSRTNRLIDLTGWWSGR